MDAHRHRLGVWNLVAGVLHLIAGAALYVVGEGSAVRFADPAVPTFLGTMVALSSLFLLVAGVLGMASGILLLRRHRRGRLTALATSFFLLIVFPLGTIVGSYGIWVLFQDDIFMTVEHRPAGGR